MSDIPDPTEGADALEPLPSHVVLPWPAKQAGGAVDAIDEYQGLARLLPFGLQHVLVMYAGTVAVPLILGSALKWNGAQVIALISADLFTSGLATLLQTLGWWKFGARLPLIQGCSFICVAPMILIGSQYGIPTMYGAVICCGLFTMLVGPLYSRMLRFFPPVVIGSVITVIGLSLLPVAGGWLGGGDSGAADFGSFAHLGLGFLTIALIVAIQRFGRGIIANLSVLLGLIAGTAVAALTGQTSFAQVGETPWLGMARPLMFGWPRFALLPALVMCVAMVVVMTETTGNCLAIGEIAGRKIGPATLTAAFRADGLSTMLGGLMNSFPYNAYSQNTGLLSLSKMKSRYTVAAGGGLLVVLGFLPKLAAVIASIPRPVLGGASIVMFGMTAMAGIEELTRVRYHGTNNAVVVAVSVSLGVLPIATPQLFAHAPDAARLFLNSGIFLAAASAVLLNLFFFQDGDAPGMKLEGVTEQDLMFLRRAIELAQEARADGRHPFGSLVVNGQGETVVEARNNAVRPKGDPTQHAETLACSAAAKLLPENELAKCTLYTSTEPCAMCAGAIYWTGIGRVVFALSEKGLLTYTGGHEENPTLDLPCREVFARGQKRIVVAGPLLEDEAGKVHEGFWSAGTLEEKEG